MSQSSFEGTVYYRQHSVLVLAPTFVAGRGDRTHRRPSVRCMIGCSGPFTVETAAGQLTTQALLMAPDAQLASIEAAGVDFALFDFAVASAEYLALQPLLQQNPLQPLDLQLFEALLPRLRHGQQGELSCEELRTLMQTVVETLTGQPVPPLKLDERVMQVMRLIDTLPLTEAKLPRLAAAAHLSTERLRHLFKKVTATTPTQYARSVAVWRVLALLEDKGITVTAASHEAGFHDVSHFYRAYADLFGINLCEKSNVRKYRRVRCFV